MKRIPSLTAKIGIALLALFGLVLAQDGAKAPPAKAAATNRYIGADKCKNCHKAAEKGNQFDTWQKSKHAEAFATLASDAAKQVASAKGIADPQKADACLKCHTTAFGLPEDQIKKGFDMKLGVQCETCHGPGEAHMKARMTEAAKVDPAKSAELQVVPAGEIIVAVDQKTCLKCHNDESPTFKPFCFYERVPKIRHLDPRKQHDPEPLVCSCATCGCVHGCEEGSSCGAPPKK